MNKKVLLIGVVLSLFLLVGCSDTQKTLIEGEVQGVGDDFVVINLEVYDLCDNKEETVFVGDYIFIMYDSSRFSNCDSDLLEIKPKDCYKNNHKHCECEEKPKEETHKKHPNHKCGGK